LNLFFPVPGPWYFVALCPKFLLPFPNTLILLVM
jgi:hypothetical protein